MSEMEIEGQEVLDETAELVEAPEAEATGTAEPSWAPSRDEWEATQQYLHQTAPLMQQIAEAQMYAQQQQMQQMGPQLPQEFDAFDPQSVQEYIQAHIQHGVNSGLQQALAPYEGMLENASQTYGEQQAREAMEMIQSELGEFDQDTAFLFASGLLDQVADPTEALRFGAQQAKKFEERIRAEERERYAQEMKELAQAPSATPANGVSAHREEATPTGRDRYEQVAARWLARQHPTSPVG